MLKSLAKKAAIVAIGVAGTYAPIVPAQAEVDPCTRVAFMNCSNEKWREDGHASYQACIAYEQETCEYPDPPPPPPSDDPAACQIYGQPWLC